MVYITERLTVNNVTGTSVTGGTDTIFETNLDTLYGRADDYYNTMTIEFTSGACNRMRGTILDYAQANGEITLTEALDAIPGEDTFIIWTGLGVNGAVRFDLPITSKFCKIVYIGIVQLTAGPMEMNFEIWESTAARLLPDARANFYQKILNRQITMTVDEGGEYGESLSGDPMPYFDRDSLPVASGGDATLAARMIDQVGVYYLHCRIVNDITDGTLSDFAVTIKVADMGENA